jgi:hypothetical protein
MSVDKQPVPRDSLDEMAEQLLSIVKQRMGAAEVEQVAQAIQLAQEAFPFRTCANGGHHSGPDAY